VEDRKEVFEIDRGDPRTYLDDGVIDQNVENAVQKE
jgi:guanyl-specific ribonuclease Sa